MNSPSLRKKLGRVVAPLPFSSSVYLATEAILQFGSEQQKARWPPSTRIRGNDRHRCP